MKVSCIVLTYMNRDFILIKREDGGDFLEYIYDAPYADKFICDGELNWHDFYYICPRRTDEKACVYQLNRTGIERECPSLFAVERSEQTPCCEIFCILSGCGSLTYRGKTYRMCKDQMILLNSHESHSYNSDPNDPLGMIWIEFLGSDSLRIMERLLELYSPVSAGEAFQTAAREISLLQQHLMNDPDYDSSVDIYRLLINLMNLPESSAYPGQQDMDIPWKLMESYIQSHLGESIRNSDLADLCGISLPYFIKCFRSHYRQTPQRYIQNRRIQASRYLLTRTHTSISSITEQLGFCNDSHFIRVFKASQGVTPARYRKLYGNL